MDYKEKYEQALERAKGLYNSIFVNNDILEQIFPELLKEDENYDEKIRNALINRFNESGELDGIPYGDIRIWLEKQGEQTSTNNELKFKVGDWITKKGATWQVLIANNDYILLGQDGTSIKEKTSIIDSEFHLWTIQDAKDGDVLCYKNDVFLLENYTLFFDTVDSYCCYGYGGRFITSNRYSFTIADFNKIYPATKGQRDLLFQKMKEAGYEWDAEKKELKKVNTYCQENCKGFQETGRCFCDGECKAKKEHIKQNIQDNDFLRIEQKPAEWSEDEKNYNAILKIIRDSDVSAKSANTLSSWLKSLRERIIDVI